jgi:hypothetical protein
MDDMREGHGMETIVLTWLRDGSCALVCACGQSQRLTHKPRTWTHFEFIWGSEGRFWIRCSACHAHIERFVSYPSRAPAPGATTGLTVVEATLSGSHRREWACLRGYSPANG